MSSLILQDQTALLEILKLATKLKKKVIIGTTGFNKKQQAEINKASKKIAILQSGNMSLGVNLDAISIGHFIRKNFERVSNGNT